MKNLLQLKEIDAELWMIPRPEGLIGIHFDEVFMKSPSESWDRSRALDAVGGDVEFLRELAGIFCAACPTLLNSLRESIAAKNLISAADTAHLLWSAARSLSSPGVAEAASALEIMARGKELENIDGAYHALRQEIRRLMDDLAEFRGGDLNCPRSEL